MIVVIDNYDSFTYNLVHYVGEFEEKVKVILQEPGKYAVVYLNDEQTPMDFVVNSLIKHFQYNQEQAMKMTNTIHNDGLMYFNCFKIRAGY